MSKGAAELGRTAYHPANEVQDDYQHIMTPPPYSGPSNPSGPTPSTPRLFPGLLNLNYALYSPASFQLSADETTITSYKPELSTYLATLNSLIQYQATIPPKAQICVKGSRSSGHVDFDLKLNMMSLLVGHSDQRERWSYLKVVDDSEVAFRGGLKESMQPRLPGGIDAWVRRFCEDKSAIKQLVYAPFEVRKVGSTTLTQRRFAVQRVVTNWDIEYLEGRIHGLVASTGYRNTVTVTFPMTHSKIVVHSPDKVSRLFTNVQNLFTGTNRYEVVKIVWPYASVPPGEDGRRFAVQSEESWWNDWKDAIRHAILSGRKGWVTVEDRLEFLMAPEKDRGKAKDWDSH